MVHAHADANTNANTNANANANVFMLAPHHAEFPDTLDT